MATFARIALSLLLALLCHPALAEMMYKSVTPDGRVVFSDRAPTEGRLEKTIKYENLPATPLPKDLAATIEQMRKSGTSQPVAAPTRGVVLYSAVWCNPCSKAKAWLSSKGIAYQNLDIDTSNGRAAFAQVGGKGVPLLVADGQRIGGFSAAAYEQFFSDRR